MITVIITTYNCASYISQAIRSILNQSHNDFELLIIDDGSNDNTEEIIEQFNDNRIRYIKREHFGRSAALNYGLKNASFNTLALMDADDISHPLRLEKQLEVMNGTENKLCYTWAAYFQDNFKIRYVNETVIDSNLNRTLALHGYFSNSSMLTYKNHILKSGGYDEKIQSAEDYDLLIKLINKSSFIVIPEVLLFQRIRKNSLSSLMYSSESNIIYNIQKPYYTELDKSFGIGDLNVQQELKGWREFFYGDKKLCRVEWLKIPLLQWDFRMYITYLISYLPTKVLNKIKDEKIKLRFEYFLRKGIYYNNIRKEFTKILNTIGLK